MTERGRFRRSDFKLMRGLFEQHFEAGINGAALLFGALEQQSLVRVVDHVEAMARAGDRPNRHSSGRGNMPSGVACMSAS